ncbi:metalloprotease [Kitasatospora sp. NPDC059599]|uniref:metalloprotease n=1 Tax=Kitasatospora sp. NPDC059599 TaxID=3346880 RepID=UPI0036B151C3
MTLSDRFRALPPSPTVAGAARRAAARGRALAASVLLATVASCGPSTAGGSAASAPTNAPATVVVPATTIPAAGRTCLTGALTYDHHDAEAGTKGVERLTTAVARGGTWELWGRLSTDGADRLLASGVTDERGGFRACAGRAGELTEAHVRFRSSGGDLWRVISPTGGTEYAFDSARLRDVAGNRDLGTLKVPADRQGAWKIVDTVGDLYRKVTAAEGPGSRCWTRHRTTGGCDELTFTWAPDATVGGFWEPDTRNVVLADEHTASRHTILHEASHWLQFELYDHWFPDAPGCENHTFDVASTPGCAWTEAFADAAAAYALGDYRYVYPDGQDFDLHNDGATAWDRGDAVQGRVGGSLLDLWAADGPDGGTWDRTVRLMGEQRSADFRQYFTEGWPRAGLSTTDAAGRIIADHTIAY